MFKYIRLKKTPRMKELTWIVELILVSAIIGYIILQVMGEIKDWKLRAVHLFKESTPNAHVIDSISKARSVFREKKVIIFIKNYLN